jgi:hypothetical protein
MPPIAVVSLLFVGAGLLVLAGVSIGRTRGSRPSRATALVMAAMTGVALGFLLRVLLVPPLLLFPLVVAGILVANWVSRREWPMLGSFLIGAGGLWTAMEGLARLNDLADPAITFPGWTPIPLALAAASVILGVTFLMTERTERT